MSQKDNKSFDNYTFQEEVDDSLLFDKKNYTDIIYVKDKKYKKKTSFLVSLAIFLIISALLLSLFALAYLNKDTLWGNENGEKYNLFVTHQNEYYGRNSILFYEHNTKDKAVDYSFDISNDNDVYLSYKVILTNPYFERDNIDMSLVNYSIYVDGIEKNTSRLSNMESVTLLTNEIMPNGKNKVIIKVWSNDIKGNDKFNFKISIEH